MALVTAGGIGVTAGGVDVTDDGTEAGGGVGGGGVGGGGITVTVGGVTVTAGGVVVTVGGGGGGGVLGPVTAPYGGIPLFGTLYPGPGSSLPAIDGQNIAIPNVGTCLLPGDAANKAYVDSLATVSPVASVFGRLGAIGAVLNDYTSSLVQNLSDVASGGSTVTSALNALQTQVSAAVGGVASVFGRTGPYVVEAFGDYNSSLINNVSSVTGTSVTAALNYLLGASGVTSFKTRTGAVTPATNDYAASQIQNDSLRTPGATTNAALDALVLGFPNGNLPVLTPGAITLDVSYLGYTINLGASGTFTFTIPGSSYAIPVGAQFTIVQYTPGSLFDVAAASGVTILNNVQLSSDPYTEYTLTQVATDKWIVITNQPYVIPFNGMCIPIAARSGGTGGLGYGMGSQSCAIGNGTGVQLDVALPLYAGLLLTGVVVTIEPESGHTGGGFPTVMPFVQIWTPSPTIHVDAALVVTVYDTSATISAYEAPHTIICNLSTPIGVGSQSAWVVVADEVARTRLAA